MPELEALLNGRGTVFFDGAAGTMLQGSGLLPGERSDIMNIRAPEAVYEIHRAYIDAGSDIILTNTFGANARALSECSLTPQSVITVAVDLARKAAESRALVALDIGPIGDLMTPHGALTPEQAYTLFREQAELGAAAGAELIAIETMSDLGELSSAVTAARDACDLPIFTTITVGASKRTYTGATVTEFARCAEDLGVAALGINCSLEPAAILPAFRELSETASLPLIAKLNAGLPGSDGSYGLTAEAFAAQMLEYKPLGVRIVGACCGSTPDFIRALRAAFGD
ncbi:MAG: homocysteine S-methyltransferase family protein [Oscillospiraceae bacterium]|jgi:5-methyltetrahydrofolate--homocysteine methyltransferase|nr:homocysteine S-methyltransferase family protein [Oscillospiraceae bacterium]